MKRNTITILMCMCGLGLGFLYSYTAFVWGFNRGAVKYAPIVQTGTVGLESSPQTTLTITPQLERVIKCTNGGW